MSFNYFKSLTDMARIIDEETGELANKWKTPFRLVGGYGERTKEVDDYLKELNNNLRDTKLDMDDLVNKLNCNDVDEINSLLKEAKDTYAKLNKEVEDIESVFIECGYTPNIKIERETNELDNSALYEEKHDIPDGSTNIEITPHLGFKVKSSIESFERTPLTNNQNLWLDKSISGRLINRNLSAVLNAATPCKTRTPISKTSEEPVYYTSCCDMIKKEIP
ncbi:uncharacterized protein [Prorops nasuta]|uniref:uncharacterized protein n=1 Tax=Prorops nasuta TaxID=863751 RepID=UPI0034CD1A95